MGSNKPNLPKHEAIHQNGHVPDAFQEIHALVEVTGTKNLFLIP